MKLPAVTLQCGICALIGFGAGWFLKSSSTPDNAVPPAGAAKRAGPPSPSKPGGPPSPSRQNWLDSASDSPGISVNTSTVQQNGAEVSEKSIQGSFTDDDYSHAFEEIDSLGNLRLSNKFANHFNLDDREKNVIEILSHNILDKMSLSLKGKIQPLKFSPSSQISFPNSTAYTIPGNKTAGKAFELEFKTALVPLIAKQKFDLVWDGLLKASDRSHVLRGFGRYDQEIVFEQTNPTNGDSIRITLFTMNNAGGSTRRDITTKTLGTYYQSLFDLE
ncbi:MAG: hypothetical protein V4675_10985 [Verrucomicrobiota bacterium]